MERFIHEYIPYVHMPSINISIKKETYDFLKELKTRDKSFSEIILGFKKEHDIMKFFGVLKDLEWNSKEKSMKSLRDSFNKR